MPRIESISAVTLWAPQMSESVAFYRQAGFALASGGAGAGFSTFVVGGQYLNLCADEEGFRGCWGRVIFYVDQVDPMYERLIRAGIEPEFSPRDAPWGERYFHVRDPAGNELSFARPLARNRQVSGGDPEP
jgi:catechol 2,3-dioxygenase-like lactoylglutathione lyase family enzyme